MHASNNLSLSPRPSVPLPPNGGALVTAATGLAGRIVQLGILPFQIKLLCANASTRILSPDLFLSNGATGGACGQSINLPSKRFPWLGRALRCAPWLAWECQPNQFKSVSIQVHPWLKSLNPEIFSPEMPKLPKSVQCQPCLFTDAALTLTD